MRGRPFVLLFGVTLDQGCGDVCCDHRQKADADDHENECGDAAFGCNSVCVAVADGVAVTTDHNMASPTQTSGAAMPCGLHGLYDLAAEDRPDGGRQRHHLPLAQVGSARLEASCVVHSFKEVAEFLVPRQLWR